MTRLPRRATLGVLACVALLAGVAVASLVLLGGSGAGSPAARPSAHATLSSRTVLFGDTVQATLDLVVPHTMAATVFKGSPNFQPFQIVSNHVDREDLGSGLERISLRYGLSCLSTSCLNAAADIHVQFRPTFVSIPGGGRLHAVWPPLLELSRAANVTTPVTDGLDFGPAVVPGLQPRRDMYEALGAAAGALVVLLAAWLVLRVRAARRRAAAGRQVSLLQALLARVEAGLPEDVLYRQRHALDALAVELRHRRINGSLAMHAERMAWAPEQPDPEDIRALCAEVRRLVKA